MRNRALGQCSDCENGVMRALCGRKIGNEGVPACLPRGVGIRCLFNAAALVFALKVELDSGASWPPRRTIVLIHRLSDNAPVGKS